MTAFRCDPLVLALCLLSVFLPTVSAPRFWPSSDISVWAVKSCNMSAPLSIEEEKSYKAIIDGILATADLSTISRKKIRQGLETSLGGKDLSECKNAIKKLIEDRFDAISSTDSVEVAPTISSPVKPSVTPNGTSGHDEDDYAVDADSDHDIIPDVIRKKPVKRSSSVEDADAKLAAQLQAEEDGLRRGRTTRGGGDTRKGSSKSKKARKIGSGGARRHVSSKKVGAEDDSDLDASGDSSAPRKRKAGGGFQKPFNLSLPLSELVGETQVVKKLWEHIKANELQDPKDKRQIRCDEKMFAVFKQSRVDMFRMNKDIGNHLYPVDE